MASEEMFFESVDDGRRMPNYTISSLLSLRLRWVKNYLFSLIFSKLRPTQENKNFGTFTISTIILLYFHSRQYIKNILKIWIKYLIWFGSYDCLNANNPKYGHLRKNVNIFINKLKVVNVTTYFDRHTIKTQVCQISKLLNQKTANWYIFSSLYVLYISERL